VKEGGREGGREKGNHTTEKESCRLTFPPSLPPSLPPSPGDFVDRGPMSIEVMLTLLVLQVAAPEFVYLNRGNHEDPGVCCLFGFMVRFYLFIY